MFNNAILSDIRDRISVVSLISERIQLKKIGRNYKGLCPFHQEKTPSFIVSDEKQIYHCFGCGEGGDIFKFVMKYEGISFVEAVQLLAEKAGIALPNGFFAKNNSKDADLMQQKKLLFQVNKMVAEYFHANLMENKGKEACNYLESRGIKKNEKLTQLFLGYAEKEWDGLVRFLEKKKIPLKLACDLGLIRERNSENNSSNGFYDFFRNRLMFPIVSRRGDVLGFSGRTLEKGDAETAKYINSVDSLIYDKSNSVYGLDLAQDAIRKKDQIILVEGNIDFVSLYLAGIENVVAPLGTSLTIGQIRLLSRLSKNMTLVFDGDKAGGNAARRALPLFIEMGLVAEAVALPEGEDPDSFIRKNGAEAFYSLMDKKQTLFEFVIDRIIEDCSDDMAGKIAAMKLIIPKLREVKDGSEQGMYCDYVAGKLKVKPEIIKDAIKKGVAEQLSKYESSKRYDSANRSEKNNAKMPAKRTINEGDGLFRAERLLTEMLIAAPRFVSFVFERIAPEDFTDDWCKKIVSIFYQYRDQKDVDFNQVFNELTDHDLTSEIRQIALSENSLDQKEIEQLLVDCITAIEKREISKGIQKINREIKDAEKDGNEKLVFELLEQKRSIISNTMR